MKGGGDPSAMVETGSSRESAEGHGRRYFGGGKGAEAAGIRKAWQEKGRVRGEDHGQKRLGVRPGTLVYYDIDRLRSVGRMILW